jgi:hypothetical protein
MGSIANADMVACRHPGVPGRRYGLQEEQTVAVRLVLAVRQWRVLVGGAVLAIAMLAVGLPAVAPSAAADGAAPTAADLGEDFPAEMAAVVTARFTPALTSDQAALGGATARLADADARQRSDEALVAQADALVATDTATLSADTTDLAAATVALVGATTTVAADHRRLGAIAVELYTDPDGGATPVTGVVDLAQAQTEATAETLVTVVTDGQEHQLDVDDAILRTDTARRRAATTAVATATAALSTVEGLRVDRGAVLAAAAAVVSTATTAVAAAQSALATETAAQAAAVAAVAEPAGAPNDGSPTILGGAALDAAQITSWYQAQGYDDLTPAPIGQLAGWYLSEGAAEGVRGDVAFAQAMVETAGFSSNDAIQYNNYAGVGHCDSCSAGLGFPTPQLGVRGQIQLLHAFADPTLTTAGLANPPVLPSLVPETEPDRGCCVTWQSLTGKWATDPLYGHTVMSVYQSMLSSVLPPSAPAG